MPVFIAKYNEGNMKEMADLGKAEDDEYGVGELDLLGTIRVPKNMRLLTERLPKSNFNNEKDNKDVKKVAIEKRTSALNKQQLYDIQEETDNKL